MTRKFLLLVRQHADAITQAWADEIYADRQMELAHHLTFRELIDYLPDVLEELALVIDTAASEAEISEAARRLRHHPQVRFQQNCLIDEVARELITLRRIVSEFIWNESFISGDIREISGALWRANVLFDELIVQAIVVYAANLRPSVRTRAHLWPPPRRRKSDFPPGSE